MSCSGILILRGGALMQKKSVLIVDDEPIWLKLLSRLLVSYGYEVVPASSCAEGLAALRVNRVDCAVLDFNLGDGTGATICAAIRERDSGIKTPVIILTSDPLAGNCLLGPQRADEVLLKDSPLSEIPELLTRLFKSKEKSPA